MSIFTSALTAVSGVTKNAITAVSGLAARLQSKPRDIKLDEMTTALKISLLILKQSFTKIAIDEGEHSIYFQDPSLRTKIVRTFSPHSHEDLHLLKEIVRKCLQLYPPYKDSPQRSLFSVFKQGLGKLEQTYKDTAITTSQLLEEHEREIQGALDHFQSTKIPEDFQDPQESVIKTRDLIALSQMFETAKDRSVNELNQLADAIEAYLKFFDLVYKAKI